MTERPCYCHVGPSTDCPAHHGGVRAGGNRYRFIELLDPHGNPATVYRWARVEWLCDHEHAEDDDSYMCEDALTEMSRYAAKEEGWTDAGDGVQYAIAISSVPNTLPRLMVRWIGGEGSITIAPSLIGADFTPTALMMAGVSGPIKETP